MSNQKPSPNPLHPIVMRRGKPLTRREARAAAKIAGDMRRKWEKSASSFHKLADMHADLASSSGRMESFFASAAKATK